MAQLLVFESHASFSLPAPADRLVKRELPGSKSTTAQPPEALVQQRPATSGIHSASLCWEPCLVFIQRGRTGRIQQFGLAWAATGPQLNPYRHELILDDNSQRMNRDQAAYRQYSFRGHSAHPTVTTS